MNYRKVKFVASIAAISMLAVPVYAQRPTERGTGIVCDTPEQIARYILSKEGDGTLEAINAESKNACAIVSVEFIPGEKGKVMRNSHGSWQIQQITVIGAVINGVYGSVEPTAQWSAFYINEENA